jgi:hypothetical protein
VLKSCAFGDFSKAKIHQIFFKSHEFSTHGSNRAGKKIERGLREFTLIFSL